MGSRKFDMPLEKLFISESLIDGFGSRDLTSCESLAHLTLIDCILKSAIKKQSLCIASNEATVIPADLSELTDLKALYMSIAGTQAKAISVDWLYRLVHLEKLKLFHKSKLILSEGMGALSRLVCMSVDCIYKRGRGQQHHPDAVLNDAQHTVLSFDWQKLEALRHFEIYGDYVVDLRLLDLITLRHLQCVTFEGHPWNRSSVSAFAIFMYRLAALRSDVHIKIHKADDLLSDSIETIWDQYIV